MEDLGTQVRRHPSAILLACQLGAVLVYPFLTDNPLSRAVLGVVSMVVVCLALVAVRATPALLWVAVALGIPAMCLSVAEAFLSQDDTIRLLNGAFHAPFYFYITYGLIKYLFHDEHVSRDELFAIGAAFTTLAWGFAYLFVVVQVVWSGSFVGPGSPEDPRGWFDLLFLSFTTLTSTGLSDVVPAGGHARSVVMLAQVAGVMYISLVIARLVGLTLVRHQRSRR